MKKSIYLIIAILGLFVVTGCDSSNKYPGYYSDSDTWDFNYDPKLGTKMEFSAGEANAYLSGKYLGSYVIKGYVYRIEDDYIYLKDKKSDEDYILVNLDDSDISSIDYEETVYVRINGLYKILANYADAEVIHENDIEEWDDIVTVKEIRELEQLLKKTIFIVYGKVKSSEEMNSSYSGTYYWTTLSSTKNGYVVEGKVYEDEITADLDEKLEPGTYVKLSCSGDNVLNEYVGLDDCTILGHGKEFKNKVELEN